MNISNNVDFDTKKPTPRFQTMV